LVCREVWSADSLSVVQIGGSCANRTFRCRASERGLLRKGDAPLAPLPEQPEGQALVHCVVRGALSLTEGRALPVGSCIRRPFVLVLRLLRGCVRGDSIARWPMVLTLLEVGCLPVGQAI
jgi:hypothetical protein